MKLNCVLVFVGPALVTTKDAGDAVTLLQSLAGSTFDSSQLVLTACMGYPNVNEARLQGLRNKHRPAIIAAVEERSNGLRALRLRDSQGLASKLYGFKEGTNKTDQMADKHTNGDLSRTNSSSANSDAEVDSAPDLQEQVSFYFFFSYLIYLVVSKLSIVKPLVCMSTILPCFCCNLKQVDIHLTVMPNFISAVLLITRFDYISI